MSSEPLSETVTQTGLTGTQDVYVGPRPFRTGETLYCRDHEADELAGLLISQRLVLAHSPSGAGKTSLIHAKLVPALRDEFLVPRIVTAICSARYCHWNCTVPQTNAGQLRNLSV
jgi:hypothetical protein